MPKCVVIRGLCIVSILLIAFVIGMQVQRSKAAVLSDIAGVWSGKSILITQTGEINYNISALVENQRIFLSLIATTEENVKFAFKLELEYLRMQRDKVVLSVSERETLWLEEARRDEQLDIPVMGHLLVAKITKLSDDEFYFSYPLGDDYVFGTVFEQGL